MTQIDCYDFWLLFIQRMDDHIDPSISVTDNIAKIDKLVEQHRREKLCELVTSYNYYHPQKQIWYDHSTDATELIIKLWSSKADIPPELTFGEPYDSCFKDFLAYSYVSSRKWTHDIIMMTLFQKSSSLKLYLIYTIQRIQYEYSHSTEQLSRKIWDQLTIINQGRQWCDASQLLVRIKHSELSPPDLVYIAIMFENARVKYGGYGIIVNFITVTNL